MTFTDCFVSLLNNYFPLIYQHFSFFFLRFVKLFSNYLKFQLKREKRYSIQGIYVRLLFEQFKCLVHVMTYYLHSTVGYVRLGLLFQVKKVANIIDTNMSHRSFRHRSLAISNKFVIIINK